MLQDYFTALWAWRDHARLKPFNREMISMYAITQQYAPFTNMAKILSQHRWTLSMDK